MLPKISVSPLATRNSSSPYWTAFRHWIRKVGKSIGVPNVNQRGVAPLRSARGCAPGRVGERLDCHLDDLVLLAFDLAQVDVLHRVVRPGHRERTARAVDLRLFDGGGE